MARPFPTNIVHPKGKLEFSTQSLGFHHVFYIPPIEALPTKDSNSENYKRRIFDIDSSQAKLTFYPYRVWAIQPMTSRYFTLHKISVDLEWYTLPYPQDQLDDNTIGELLDYSLPSIFTRDYNYGLGFKKEYRFIVNMLERIDIEHLIFTNTETTVINREDKVAIINRRDLNKLIQVLDSITERTRKISAKLKAQKTEEVFFQLLLNTASSQITKPASSHLLSLIGNENRFQLDKATKKEQSEAIEVIKKNSNKILKDQPDELFKLRDEIELVTLQELVEKFEAMLAKKLPESHWQKIFDTNPFILHMAIGIPVIKVQGQISVGGRKFSGSGDKIADFLLKNSITNNAAIVEIKTPDTKLINKTSYRSDIYSASNELVGAINQTLDQIHKFQKNIASLKENSRIYNLEAYSVTGVLIIGQSQREVEQQKSFELFRGNSKQIQIITFDELLSKLKCLYLFLGGKLNNSTASENNSEIDLPF